MKFAKDVFLFPKSIICDERKRIIGKHKLEGLIDDYLLNRLNEDEKGKFEEIYFNSPHCFEKMLERDELISVVKHKGDMIFQDR